MVVSVLINPRDVFENGLEQQVAAAEKQIRYQYELALKPKELWPPNPHVRECPQAIRVAALGWKERQGTPA